MRTPLRMAIPAGVIAVCVVLLIGCLPLPIVTAEDPRPEEKIGDASSKRPLRLKTATTQDVRTVLGQPAFATADGRTLVYEYEVNELLVVGPLCWMPGRPASRYLTLTFDEQNVLKGFKVTKDLDDDRLQPVPSTRPSYDSSPDSR